MKQKLKTKRLPILILIVGCVVTATLVALEDDEMPAAPPGELLAVEVAYVQTTDYRLQIPAWGFVEALENIDIRAEVPGKVTHVADTVLAGGRVKRGESLFTIDERDYRNKFEEAQAVHEQAKQALEIEKGLQAVAKAEWATLARGENTESEYAPLALREPYLKDRQAAVRIAAAQEAQAALVLERTHLTSPCDGVIVREMVGVGQYLDTQEVALSIACSERRRIRAWFAPEYAVSAEGASAKIRVGGMSYVGVIRTMLPQIDPETRQKQALVEIEADDITFGAYAELTLPGRAFENVIVMPVSALRPDTTAWVLDENDTLAVRHLTVLARDARMVVVANGLEEQDRIILSHIAHPLQGMPLVPAEHAEAVRGGENL
jgi:RND family efflux transporter MFP subunit